MKDHLVDLVAQGRSPLQGRNIAREYLQARILSLLQRDGAMVPLAFQGGTALRFLYRLPRHSEDLEFALEGNRDLYSFERWLEGIRKQFQREDYQVRLKVSLERIVQSAFVQFPGLPHELGLSAHRGEILSVKIEVDTRPPAGAQLETSLVRRYVTLQLHHHDKASLLAGKLHAILNRPYAKGRDWYDLVWYLSDSQWPGPNVELLKNALAQTDREGDTVTKDNWRSLVIERARQLDWALVRNDAAPFLEDQAEVELLTRDNLLRLLH